MIVWIFCLGIPFLFVLGILFIKGETSWEQWDHWTKENDEWKKETY